MEMMVTKVDTKTLWISILLYLTKGTSVPYNVIYRDGKSGHIYKRFNVSGVTRDKLYDLTNGNKDHNPLF
jgi:topoisomerase-4 subunit A